MTELILVDGPGETPVARLLDAMGAIFKKASIEHAVDSSIAPDVERRALIITEQQLAKAYEVARARGTNLPQLFRHFARALIYPLQGTPQGARALSAWTGGTVEMKRLDAAVCAYSVAPRHICGPFAGLQLGPANAAKDLGLMFHNTPVPVEHLIRIGGLGLFTKVILPGTEVFVIGSSAVLDVETEVFRNLNAAECFSGLVPLILFLRDSAVVRWHSPRRWANVVLDDPNLKPDYGFVNFRKLTACLDELGIAMSIGFIPWNCTRTAPEAVDLIRPRWPRLSIAVHGCDHTDSEFSTQTVQQAQELITLGLDRMRHFSARTGLRHDKVMVFPQGRFSAAAMQALRTSELHGAVNTELVDLPTGHGVRACELLKPAITSYAGFPLFLRRPPEEPIANFALDVLLGKPCLIVIHHDYFRQGMQPLISLVHALNSLFPTLVWTNLESVVSKSILVRANPDRMTDVRLFSAVTEVERQDWSGPVNLSKVEPLPGTSFRATVGGELQACTLQNEHLHFGGHISTAEPVTIEVRVSPSASAHPVAQSPKHRAQVAARRYLSEFRDNHVAKSAWMTTALRLARNVTRDPISLVRTRER